MTSMERQKKKKKRRHSYWEASLSYTLLISYPSDLIYTSPHHTWLAQFQLENNSFSNSVLKTLTE